MTDAARSVFQTVTLAVALMGFWIACVSSVRLHELLVGVAATVVSTAFSIFVIRTLPLHFRPTFSQVAEIWRLPWNVAVDLAQVIFVLLLDFAGRSAPSLFRATRWRPVASDGTETASRTLATAYTTISPNMVVVGIDCERRWMLFHQISKSEVPAMTQRLGAEPGR